MSCSAWVWFTANVTNTSPYDVRRTSANGHYYGPELDEPADELEPEQEPARPVEVAELDARWRPMRWSDMEAHERGKRAGR